MCTSCKYFNEEKGYCKYLDMYVYNVDECNNYEDDYDDQTWLD